MFSLRIFTVCTLICACSCTLPKSGHYRLPRTIKPIHYDLTVEPDIYGSYEEGTIHVFNGSVQIRFDVLETGRNIVFHAYKLDIDYYNFRLIDHHNDNAVNPIVSYTINETYQIHEIVLEHDLIANNCYTMQVIFGGVLDDMGGFFSGWYGNSNTTGLFAATFFQPSQARKAFPCFDEPAMKATFTINLVRRENYSSVSNERLERTEYLGDGRFKDTFKTTPPMSTYTVTYAVSDLPATKWSKGQRVIGEPTLINEGRGNYVLDIGVLTLEKFEEYTCVPYPISKMEHLGIPDRFFPYDAMENYGLIIYKESALLPNSNDSFKQMKRTTITVVHEFAHQWFGNLVTPQWWNYLWLSESFACYFSYYMIQYIEPSWEIMDQFLIDVVFVSYNKEQSGSDPLNNQLDDIGEFPRFNIMYEKGATIVRMLNSFLTSDLFRKGLQLYLNTHMYSNTLPRDMYAAYQTVVSEAQAEYLLGFNTVEDIMNTWDSTIGYPVVLVSRDYTTGDVEFEQREIFTNSANLTRKIPINWVFSDEGILDFDDTTTNYWLTSKKNVIGELPNEGWLIVNKQMTGYYRVLYDLENWERLIVALDSHRFKQIHPINRAQIIDDSFNLAMEEMLPFDIFIRLSKYIKRELDYVALSTFITNMTTFIQFIRYYGNTTFFSEYAPNSKMSDLELAKIYFKDILSDVSNFYKNKPNATDTPLEIFLRDRLNGVQKYVLS